MRKKQDSSCFAVVIIGGVILWLLANHPYWVLAVLVICFIDRCAFAPDALPDLQESVGSQQIRVGVGRRAETRLRALQPVLAAEEQPGRDERD